MPGKQKNHPSRKYRGGAKKLEQPKLTPKQVRMIDFWFTAANFNKTEAARMAGYADPDHNAWALFNKPGVQMEIRRRQEQMRKKVTLDEEWLIDRLIAKASANMGEIMEKLRQHDYDLGCLSPDEQYVISEWTEEVYAEGRGDAKIDIKKIKLKIESNLAALDKLMRHRGLYKDSLEVTGEMSLVERLQQGRNRVAGAKKQKDAAA